MGYLSRNPNSKSLLNLKTQAVSLLPPDQMNSTIGGKTIDKHPNDGYV